MQSNLKAIVRGAYDIQKLRIQMGNRIVANFRVKLGIDPGEKETSQKESKQIIDRLRLLYKNITEGITKTSEKFSANGNEIISNFTEYVLIAQYFDLVQSEKTHFKRLEKALEEYPIYTAFLKKTKGIGPAMAGVIISEIDINKAAYPSSLWKYAGLDVAPDGKGRSRKKEHLEEKTYIDKNGEIATKKGITFNPFLKTKLLGVLGPSFLKCKGPYSDIYYNYRNRLENHPNHAEKSKGHRHNMAIRYMIKMFLLNLYKEWRTLEGLTVNPPYETAKLQHEHGVTV